MRLFLFFLFGFSLTTSFLVAQTADTVTVMTYNLLYYRENTSFCTNSNNRASTKDDAMKDIIDHVIPDILLVNEMGGSSSLNPARLALNALNQNGRTFYKTAKLAGTSQSLINVLYYNENKFVLESQTNISKDINNSSLVRVIDLYNLRYKDPNLSIHNDTTRIHVFAAHLKAGSTTSNENERAEATEAVMAYLDSNKLDGNYLFTGDLNLYKSSEPAYKDLTDYVDTAYRFYDPIKTSGTWHNDSRFASLHTQSTRTSGGCFAGGGMDDRFDFILASDEIMNNEKNIHYIDSTYKALAQDGKRFNGSIDSPTNTSVPSTVVTALKDMSDHLPVIMDLKITLPVVTSLAKNDVLPEIIFENPTQGRLEVNLIGKNVRQMELMNLSGQIIWLKNVRTESFLQEDISNLPNGTYFLRVTYEGYQQAVKKLIKI